MSKRAKTIVDDILSPPPERVLEDGTVVRKREKKSPSKKLDVRELSKDASTDPLSESRVSSPLTAVYEDELTELCDSPPVCGDTDLLSKFFAGDQVVRDPTPVTDSDVTPVGTLASDDPVNPLSAKSSNPVRSPAGWAGHRELRLASDQMDEVVRQVVAHVVDEITRRIREGEI